MCWSSGGLICGVGRYVTACVRAAFRHGEHTLLLTLHPRGFFFVCFPSFFNGSLQGPTTLPTPADPHGPRKKDDHNPVCGHKDGADDDLGFSPPGHKIRFFFPFGFAPLLISCRALFPPLVQLHLQTARLSDVCLKRPHALQFLYISTPP
jgi:hypothetical protein